MNSHWTIPEIADWHLDRMGKSLGAAAQEVQYLIWHSQICAGSRVLDLGCGAGRHSIEFARHGYAVTGVDISGLLISEASSRASVAGLEIEFAQADMLSWVRDSHRRYDLVISLHESGFGELGGDERDLDLLFEVRRLPADNGHFALITYNGIRRYRSPGPAFDHVKGIVHWSAPLADGGAAESDIRVYTPSELGAMLRRTGFQSSSFRGCRPDNLGAELGLDDIEMLAMASCSI